jgi:hypothetical protein
MRANPYQARARALAIESGLDPDAKIDRPGQRPMQTWCTFRDTARREQVAAETSASSLTKTTHRASVPFPADAEQLTLP